MNTKLQYTSASKFKWALVIFSFIGQVAWVVENMYFNVFIYKMFNASATDISLMVSASAITAALTTLFIGALSDKIAKRRLLISLGYVFWGFSILSFALIRMDLLTKITGSVASAASLGVSLVILMDCVMTFFGSSANDAAFNAWLTDCGTQDTRGKIEGINSMMPLIAILAVFGGFMAFNLDQSESWTSIFLIIGGIVVLIGFLGFFLIEDHISVKKETQNSWLENVIYSFRPSVIKENILLYVVSISFAVFCISIQVFMPYLILYYEKTLGMTDYVLIMAPAVILAAVITAFYGKVYDMLGFQKSVIPSVLILMLGYVFLYFTTDKTPVFIGSLLMMSGYLTGMAVFGAMVRENIPEDKSGQFQGIRIIAQVLIPGIIGPFIGAKVLQNAELILNSDGTTSFLPNKYIYLAAFIVAIVLLVVLFFVFKMMKTVRKDFTPIDDSIIPFKEYPRPQLKRDSFFNLNGKWLLNGNEILVPFPPESKKSGYTEKVKSKLEYVKEFTLPQDFEKSLFDDNSKNRLILHFGAVDQIVSVCVDGFFVGTHTGGYLPFSFDVTDYLSANTIHEIRLQVKDTLSHKYPYGKQRKNRGGMWYTPVSGIWQTVWMEVVPEIYVSKMRIEPDMKGFDLFVEITNCQIPEEDDDFAIKVKIQGKSKNYEFTCQSTGLRIDLRTDEKMQNDFDLWSPENPALYDFTVELYASKGDLEQGKKPVDSVKSYFGLREISVKEINGVNRICLNEKPVFLHGVLDQGYFVDGIYLPESEDGFRSDIQNMQELGINTLRKHIKIEPDIFYYECDKAGMLIMQDMVNNGSYRFFRDTAFPTIFGDKGKIGKRKHLADKALKTKTEKFFLQHSEETLEHLFNHPCVVYYTIFNEGWGQFKANYVYNYLKDVDSSRIFDTASGWFKNPESDVESDHIYFKTPSLVERAKNSEKPLVVSECGGYTLKIENHIWNPKAKYGYGGSDTIEGLTDKIEDMYNKMIIPAIKHGLCGCVYTQLSDVEDEINGFYTYDRQICKVNKDRLKAISKALQR